MDAWIYVADAEERATLVPEVHRRADQGQSSVDEPPEKRQEYCSLINISLNTSEGHFISYFIQMWRS